MEKDSLNYLKKQAQLDYIEHRITLRPFVTEGVPLIEKAYIYEGHITPNRMISNKNVYEITHLDPLFILNGFLVITENDMVKNIILLGHHPNRDPDTHLYCLPDLKKNVKYDSRYYENLVTSIKTYYLDNCFFKPTKVQATYKKLQSIFFQLNK